MADEQRVDPDDGQAYTFALLSEYYKNKYSKKALREYWEKECRPVSAQGKSKPKAKAKVKSKAKALEKAEEGPASADQVPIGAPPILRRTRSWLVKVGGVALLPCEEKLAPLLEEHATYVRAGDVAGMDAVQLRILQAHPFVNATNRPVKPAALADGVSCESVSYKMNVPKFQRWLRSAEGKPFAEKGKGYDDGCYLTSALLRMFMPRGYSTFTFKNTSGETASVILRGFLKFTGLTATDEDEESGATAEVDAFMFHGYKRSDAQRFVVTTKSNGENGKYTARKVFGAWYCFAGSKNTGFVWQLDTDVSALYPIPDDCSNGGAAQVGPKIIKVVADLFKAMPADQKVAFLETLHNDCSTVMIELNDPDNEHIFPIEAIFADHVAVLMNTGYPLPQRGAYALFDKFQLHHVTFEIYDDMGKLDTVMEQVRARTDIEGAVIYLERDDDRAVGLVKVKSDHYVIARRTREMMRSALITAVGKDTPVDKALHAAQNRLQKGMKELQHVGGCKENHEEWAGFASAFAASWAAAYKEGNDTRRKALVEGFQRNYGSMYMHFWEQWREGVKNPEPWLKGAA